jgi:hypothetical protein
VETLTDIPLDVLVWYVGLLDRIPDYWRAMIAGGLLVLMLAHSRRKVPARDVQFSISFAKTSLVVLAITPLVVWLLPASRFNVLVERLEPVEPANLAWLSALAVWLGGFLIGATRLLAGTVATRAGARALPTVAKDHKLSSRLAHWQRRLGIGRPLTLALAGDTPRYLPGARRIVLPRAAEHWPAPAADVLIIQALCRMIKRQGRWHLLAQLVACAYWPVPWVRQVHERLTRDFHIATDTLAAACYQDNLGYQRALQQIEQRLGPATDGSTAAADAGAITRFRSLNAYRSHLGACFQPRPGIDWSAATLKRVHDERREVVWTEPGERLVVLVGQAVFVALLVGGVTLKEIPPEVERDYSITLNPKWMDTAFRNPSRYGSPQQPGEAGSSSQ